MVCACLLFNLYALLFFYVFPFTDLLQWDADPVKPESLRVHYIFFSIYVLFFIMTIWSFISASCTDPGFVPRTVNSYDKTKLPKREQLLWNYLEELKLDPDKEVDIEKLV